MPNNILLNSVAVKIKELWICYHPNDIKIVPEIFGMRLVYILLQNQNALLEANHSELSK
jgi:hypothetical protein